ncbi:MAG TPA: 50S ribosomal protein L4 [Clostridia bacterium]|nr:50S ribosomal protein L4 [Clostridia bacterium]HPQ46081.1 50S ribosomal protein L4 [Clostridia bacterium]HRX42460.1 50S ribosomal protein L4 [Clostridia bacterium]
MPKVDVYDMNGKVVDSMELNKDIFGITVSETAMHSAVVTQLSNARQGTQSAKTRAEVRGGKKRPWRQKGTGRARHGGTVQPQWTGGGVAFAPKPRSYRMSMPKKLRRLAMKSALTSKVNDGTFMVLDKLEFAEIKTKAAAEVLGKLNATESTLLVMPETNETIIKSMGNIPGVKTTVVNALNVYDILKYDKCIMTRDAVARVEEVYV